MTTVVRSSPSASAPGGVACAAPASAPGNASDDRAPDKVFLGRQPIFDRQLRVSGYELLYRSSGENRARFVDGDEATHTVLVNTLVEFGLDHVVGDHPAYVNVGAGFLQGGHCEALPQKRVVLEILEDVPATPEIIAAVRSLKSQGFRIALDDFSYNEDYRPLIELADVIKVDVRALSMERVQGTVDRLQQFSAGLLAEKVETHDEFEQLRSMGFHQFQGYFICTPRVLEGRRIPANRLATLQLLARLQDPNVDIKELEKLIRCDPSLSFKLLRYIDSSACGLRTRVESIRQAATLVGLGRLRTWANLVLCGGLRDKPRELATTAIVRARMCDGIAQMLRQPRTERFFTVGLFSLLDAFADMPLDEILALIPLSDEIKGALTTRQGILAEVLEAVIAYERGEFQKTEQLIAGKTDIASISKAWVDAVEWAQQNLGAVAGL